MRLLPAVLPLLPLQISTSGLNGSLPGCSSPLDVSDGGRGRRI